jgi:Septum formation
MTSRIRLAGSLTVAAMIPRKRLAGVASTGVLAVVLVAGCSGPSPAATSAATSRTPHKPSASTSTAAEPSAKPPPPAPDVGTCRNLTYSDISRFSNDDPKTPCRKSHTSYTFEVKKLPSDVAFEGVQIANDAVQNSAATACRKSFGRFIGGDPATQALSRLTVTYFVPTQADFDLGAHWVRCDVVALQAANMLGTLPRNVHNLLSSPDALRRYGVCSNGEPGSAAVRLVMCNQAHGFRAVAAIRLGDDTARYPDPQVVRSGGEQRCKAYLDQLLGPEGGYTYAWTYPSPKDWRAGQRFGYCWHKTTS